jgi:uncharacterized protein YjbI with pentapeptide repeats
MALETRMYLVRWFAAILATVSVAIIALWMIVEAFTWWSVLYAVIFLAGVSAAVFIVAYPRVAIRAAESSRHEDVVAVIKARNEIRTAWAQLFAGVGFFATFMLSIYNFNREFAQRREQAEATRQSALADQYSKAISFLSEKQDKAWQVVGGLYQLEGIAKREPTPYHGPIYNTITDFLIRVSQARCVNGADKRRGHKIPPELLAAVKILNNRDLRYDDQWHKYNLDDVCLSGAKLLDARGGLNRIWYRNARFLHADLRNVDLTEAKLSDVLSSVLEHEEWESLPKKPQNAEELFGDVPNDTQERITTNAEGATLIKAELTRAHFEGTYFAKANFSRADMKEIALQFASLNDAILTDTTLAGANLAGSEAKRAIFTNADLSKAILRSANFSNAVLGGAILSGADISDADFSGVKLTPAQLLSSCVSAGAPKNIQSTVSDAVIRGGGIPKCPSQ